MANDRLHLSPDGRWLFGVRGFRGPALDVYDLAKGEIVRRLTPKGVKSNSFPSGTWTGGHFYFYAANDDGSGRLWTVTPESTQLGEGVAVGSSAKCVAAGNHFQQVSPPLEAICFCMKCSDLRLIAGKRVKAKCPAGPG